MYLVLACTSSPALVWATLMLMLPKTLDWESWRYWWLWLTLTIPANTLVHIHRGWVTLFTQSLTATAFSTWGLSRSLSISSMTVFQGKCKSWWCYDYLEIPFSCQSLAWAAKNLSLRNSTWPGRQSKESRASYYTLADPNRVLHSWRNCKGKGILFVNS